MHVYTYSTSPKCRFMIMAADPAVTRTQPESHLRPCTCGSKHCPERLHVAIEIAQTVWLDTIGSNNRRNCLVRLAGESCFGIVVLCRAHGLTTNKINYIFQLYHYLLDNGLVDFTLFKFIQARENASHNKSCLQVKGGTHQSNELMALVVRIVPIQSCIELQQTQGLQVFILSFDTHKCLCTSSECARKDLPCDMASGF